MSRNPSPAPAPHSLPPPSLSSRHKQKSFGIGIAAGAEDVKYQAKYKELKRKVKDIEADNDKLHIKVMNAKLSIQRMKMERAILYERLSVVPPSPSIQEPLPLNPPSFAPAVPPHQAVAGVHHHREIPDHASLEPDHAYQAYQEYNNRPRGIPRPAATLDSRSASLDNPAPPAVASSPHMSILHSPRRPSGEHDARQHLPPPQQLPPGHQYENARTRSSAHTSPLNHHDYPTSSHSRTRSQSSSRTRSQHLQGQSYRGVPYPETLPTPQQAFSPPLSERERSRRTDMRGVPSSHVDSHSHAHHQSPLAQLSPRTHSAEIRSRMHPHQRIGPGTYINRDEYQERHPDRDREHDWEHERNNRDLGRNRDLPSIHSPHSVHRPRQPMERGDYPDHHMSSREEQAHFYDGPPLRPYPLVSRSGTPGSGSASGSGVGLNEESSRPDSRTQYYEHDRARSSSYRLRPVTHANPSEDIDFVHEDGRSHSRPDRTGSGGGNFAMTEQNRPGMESRKRSRNDMDVDSENDLPENSRGASALYSTGRLQEDRGTKRYHRQHRRSVDIHEDSRVGPS